MQAAAAHLSRVGWLTHAVPTARDGEAGPLGVGRGWETRRGQRPRSRFAACLAPPAPARLFGKAGPPPAVPAATVGRVLAQLSAFGPLRLCPAGAGRAVRRLAWARRSGPCAPTSRSVWGTSQGAEPQALPGQGPVASRQAQRPARTPSVLSPRCVAPAGPLGGQREDGKASAQARQTPGLAARAPSRAPAGGPPGAWRAVAAAALGTADHRAARGETWCSTRGPAPEHAGGRGMAAAGASPQGGEGGGRAPTPPTRPRPGPVETGAAAGGP